MNERIKELADEIWAEEYWENANTDKLLPAQLNRFAQLIIAECAQACINMGNEYEIKSAGQYQAELFAFAIKQHFGVEE
jgi:lysozyme family protein